MPAIRTDDTPSTGTDDLRTDAGKNAASKVLKHVGMKPRGLKVTKYANSSQSPAHKAERSGVHRHGT